jgi:NitT/TauT family transport system substrate-binding protein
MPLTTAMRAALAATIVLAGAALGGQPAAAEHIKIGASETASGGAGYLAIEKGYFAAEGLDVEIVFFDAAPPIAVATVSGDIDIGTTGLSGGFYNLAAQGGLRIIGAQGHEAPGFHTIGYFISRRAFDGGFTSLRNLAGHAIGLSQVGTPGHYVLGATAEKYEIPLSAVRVVALQSTNNVLSAMSGGQVDGTVTVLQTALLPLIDRGDLKVLSWAGDEIAFQDRAIFVTTKTADEKREMLERFLRAYRKGARDYHDAFTGPDERPKDGPTAAATIAIIAKYVGQSTAAVRSGIAYIDPELRVNVEDVKRQIGWYKAQGMLKSDVDAAKILDMRYIVPLAEH